MQLSAPYTLGNGLQQKLRSRLWEFLWTFQPPTLWEMVCNIGLEDVIIVPTDFQPPTLWEMVCNGFADRQSDRGPLLSAPYTLGNGLQLRGGRIIMSDVDLFQPPTLWEMVCNYYQPLARALANALSAPYTLGNGLQLRAGQPT